MSPKSSWCLLFAFLLAGWNAGFGQSLYMPRNIANAYANGTREADGKPGKNYWQNRARYRIDVTAMPPDRNIQGDEDITYFNNSPDTLRNPVIKLFLNIHKPGAPRVQGAPPDYLTDGVTIDAFSVDGQSLPFPSNPYLFTWQQVHLPRPLVPHDSLKLTFRWHYPISERSNREGMIDSTTYFLAYFYPRVAVFDDIDGWDRMNFTDVQEFYSDFNDYDVKVHVPDNYLVWGTGTIQEPEKLLQAKILQKFRQSLVSDRVVQIADAADIRSKNITVHRPVNEWQFKAVNIPDMAFGLSDHFVWDGTSVVVDDATGRRASAQAAYNDTAKDYHHVAGFARHSLEWLSHHWPGLPYPYEKTTVFQGFAGMEYPMMANDETYPDTIFSRFVAEHEIAHTYMPFYMGINETRYGFMDEGWATTFEYLVGTADLGKERADEAFKQFRVHGWVLDFAPDQDIPIIYPGDVQTGAGLGSNEYVKPSLGYLAVKDMLGDALFKKCLLGYMDRWHGKHPSPWDFFNTINDLSGKDLNWFWNNWFFSPYRMDVSVNKVVQEGQGYTLYLDNIGGCAIPFDLDIKFGDGSTKHMHLTSSVWENNLRQAKIELPGANPTSIQVNTGIYMDIDESNNKWAK